MRHNDYTHMKSTKMSVFQAVVLGFFGAAAVGATLIFAFLSARGDTSAIGPISIWGTVDKTAFQTVLRSLADSDSRFSQVTYEQKDATTYESDLANALAAGVGPDIFLMKNDATVLDGGKAMLVPISSLSATDFSATFADGMSVFFTKDGAYGIPLLIDPLVLFWNKDSLAAAGYALPPNSWAAFPAMATYDVNAGPASEANKHSLTRRDTTGAVQRSAVALGEYQNVNHAKIILTTIIMQAGGTITTTDSAGKLTSLLAGRSTYGTDEGSQSATESALRFYTEFANPAKDDYSWSRALPSSIDAFARGDLALYLGLGSEATLIARKNPNLNFSIAGLPQNVAQADAGMKMVGGGEAYALAVSKQSKNPQGAFTIAFLLGNSDAADALAKALGMVSAERKYLAVRSADLEGLLKGQALVARFWMDPDPVRSGEILRAMIEDTTSGALKLSEAVQRADRAMNALITGDTNI